MSFLVSKEQRVYLRSAHAGIGLAWEASNLLDSKKWCGNVVSGYLERV